MVGSWLSLAPAQSLGSPRLLVGVSVMQNFPVAQALLNQLAKLLHECFLWSCESACMHMHSCRQCFAHIAHASLVAVQWCCCGTMVQQQQAEVFLGSKVCSGLKAGWVSVPTESAPLAVVSPGPATMDMSDTVCTLVCVGVTCAANSSTRVLHCHAYHHVNVCLRWWSVTQTQALGGEPNSWLTLCDICDHTDSHILVDPTSSFPNIPNMTGIYNFSNLCYDVMVEWLAWPISTCTLHYIPPS